MSEHPDLLVEVLRQPLRLRQLDIGEWERLIRLARHADLLGRVAELALADGFDLPPPVLRHLQAEQVVLKAQRASVEREFAYMARALSEIGDLPLVLLKGAAYLAADLPAAQGRTFSDIDLLVPRAALPAVESALMAAGWMSTKLDAYDQRYYREWMHELPPLQHLRRLSVLDVHHNIMPLTARLRPDAELLLAAACEVPGRAPWRMLSPPDMVLHSMTHLFHNEEFSHGLRDLSDLDALLRHFGGDSGFWASLLERARRLDLRRPLYYGLRYTRRLLGTPLPPEVAAQIEREMAPPLVLRPLMDALWQRVLCASHPLLAPPRLGGVARFLLYVRSHWLKMPVWRLLPHLLHKALLSTRSEPQKAG